MDTKYLNYIVALAKRKNMTKAAEELYISQSSLSQYLSKLEQELGTPLFIRSKGEMNLTPAGQLYIDAAQNIIEIKKELYNNIHNMGNSKRLTVGVTSQFGFNILTNIITQFKKQFPNVTLEITENNPQSLTNQILHEETIDFGIMALNTVSPFHSDQIEILRKEEIYLAIPANHPYHNQNQKQSISVEDLSSLFEMDNFILSKKGSTLRVIADELFSKTNFKLNTMCETNNVPANRNMVAMGMGITLVAESCVTDKVHIAYYSLEPKVYRYNALVWRKSLIFDQPENTFYSYIKNYFTE